MNVRGEHYYRRELVNFDLSIIATMTITATALAASAIMVEVDGGSSDNSNDDKFAIEFMRL